MNARAWPLLLLLLLAPATEAVGGLFHLCQGEVRLDFACCCHHDADADQVEDRHAPHSVSAAAETCCGELQLGHPSPAPGTSASRGDSWRPALAAFVPPVSPTVPAPVEGSAFLPGRSSSARSTDTPLFIQHRSYLI